jgi:hypothetical protein
MRWVALSSFSRTDKKVQQRRARRSARPGLEFLDRRRLLSGVGAVSQAAPIVPAPGTAFSHLVYPGPDGHLVYTADTQGNRIPDFSEVGYEAGSVPVPGTSGAPDVPVKAVVSPAPGDASARIQAAIDKVSRLPLDPYGFRGAVLLQPGEYDISSHIDLTTSGVVLRGSGMGPGGTLLRATGTARRYIDGLVRLEGLLPFPRADLDSAALPKIPGTERGITDAYVPVGATSFHVTDASGLHVGDAIIVHRPSTAAWIHAIGMDTYGAASWRPGTKDLNSDRVIIAIRGNLITIDAPLTNSLERTFGAPLTTTGPVFAGTIYKYSFPGRIDHVGVEHLSGTSDFTSPTDENHAWTFISAVAVEDAWVRDISASHFAFSAVSVEKTSKWVTVEHAYSTDPISQIIGGRRYSFFVGGQLTLVVDCHAKGGRHDFVTASLVPGPNAFVDCTADGAFSETGPHQRWATGILYDNVTVHGDPSATSRAAGALSARNHGLGDPTSLQGWAGANVVIWNSTADSMDVEKPPTAQNWAIGAVASSRSGDGYYESFGKHVKPRSLYFAQLNDRLGVH